MQIAAQLASPSTGSAQRDICARVSSSVSNSKVDYQVFSLSNPNRVVVELPDVNVRLPTLEGNNPSGLVKTFRAGLAAPRQNPHRHRRHAAGHRRKLENQQGQGRSVPFGAHHPSRDAALINPRKRALPQPSGLGAAGLQPPLPRLAESPEERAAKAFRPIIVLDPGHGGYDSGAVKLGTVEKDVVLAFGLVLRDLLEKTGRYKVLMTRSDDTFIPLDERTAFAERNKASLFIAIHADYSDDGSRARGATIYSLRDGVAKSSNAPPRATPPTRSCRRDEIDTVKNVNDDVGTVKTFSPILPNATLE